MKNEEESARDRDKIIQFQISKDIEKLIAAKGSYKERSEKYLSMRQEHADFVEISAVPKMGMNGDFRQISRLTRDRSWRISSKPYGEIAHKRHLEYIANLPKGPTKDEVIAVQQRKIDEELWDKVKYGRTELNVKQRRKQWEDSQQQKLLDFVRDNKVDIHKAERQRAAALKNNHFEGTTFPYDLAAKGLPVVQLSSEQSSLRGAASNLVRDRPAYYEVGKASQSKETGALKTFVGKRSVEQQFWEYMAAIKLRGALISLKADPSNTASDPATAPSTSKYQLLSHPAAKIHPAPASSPTSPCRPSRWQQRGREWLDTLAARMSVLAEQAAALRGGRQALYQAESAEEKQAIVEGRQQQLAAVQRAVQEERQRLQDLEASLRPNEQLQLRGLVPQQVLSRHARVLRRLQALERDSAVVLSSKQAALDAALQLANFSEPVSQGPRLIHSLRRLVATSKRLASPFLLQPFPATHAARTAKGDLVALADMLSPQNEERLRQLVLQRRVERRRQRMLFHLMNDILMVSEDGRHANEVMPTADDLVLAATAGYYNDVIDILFHVSNPVSVNEPNSDGMLATYAVLRMMILDAVTPLAGRPGEEDDLFADVKAGALRRAARRTSSVCRAWLGVDPLAAWTRSLRRQSMDIVLQLLLLQGGRFDGLFGDYDTDAVSLLHVAAGKGSLAMMNWLLDAGLGVNSLSQWGKTPLITSAEHGCLQSAVLLLQRGAMSAVNHTDREGNTALHYVAQKGSQDFAMLLLTCDASVSIRNSHDLSAEELALSLGRSAMAVVLSSFQPPPLEHRHRMEFLWTEFQKQQRGVDLDDGADEEEYW
eukprot:CAMPEP_0170095938 /NCGR_PEP_ID=MMETSP0019_2-20121128/28267_1 /TAXON_ID=98059 /ORGANISM="Dinobryon sp., Strain UTEXLB2267" /LENGTH=825 /DNA_ID=CAMNT_0010317791 /DNA_START=242 /DNA_END=2716 /DNA_ORIENTATION=+